MSRNVLPSDGVIVTSKLVIAFLVEVVTLRIEEVAARKDVEVVLVILSWSVLNLLSSVFLHSWRGLQNLRSGLTFLRHHS